jgi:bifunctional DNA-binding transcriptional regulator/antitoxin component of YhaV-PrlF toxin-antitoxin module
MVKFKTHIDSQGKFYLPKTLRNELGTNQLNILTSIKTAFVYPQDSELEDVLFSLNLIKRDLEQRIDLDNRS